MATGARQRPCASVSASGQPCARPEPQGSLVHTPGPSQNISPISFYLLQRKHLDYKIPKTLNDFLVFNIFSRLDARPGLARALCEDSIYRLKDHR